MPLASGARLGPYEIIAMIGEGGMGEVYRARDTRLNRDVALKVSKEQFSERFEREARAVAALNHPNICHLYDVGPNFLVMEFVEGETLASQISTGPLPLDLCLKYARQIADGIEAAHDKGIVHRDLKPANIKITPDGLVKVLDFGLAKALESDLPSSVAQDSPTLSMAMTRAGMILGTAAYMAPEQAKGRPADRRADIWAFGVVLFEMLEGKQTFTGDTAAETLASVLKEPIAFSRLPGSTPPVLRRLIERCLHRDPKLRLQAIGEARIILDGPLEEPVVVQHTPPDVTPAKQKKSWIPWSIAAVLLVALAGALAWIFKPSPPLAVTRFPFPIAEDQHFSVLSRSFMALSPDGTQLVYVASNRLFLRSMSELEAHEIPGTNLGAGIANPVFSPDGKSLAFLERNDRSLKRIAVTGGTAVTVCPIVNLNPTAGMSWGEDGILMAQTAQGILRISPDGGQPEVLIAAKGNEVLEGPQMLPGGNAVLFTVATGTTSTGVTWDKAQVVVQTLKTSARKILVDGGSDGRYLPTGHLAYALGGVVFGIPFDAGRLETRGGPVGLVEGVARGDAGAAHFAFSNNGSLIYLPGPVSTAGSGQRELALVDRKGDVDPLKGPPAAYVFPRVSRDGKWVTYEIDDGKDSSIWVYELAGGTAPRRLTLAGSGSNRYPVWSADGQRVAFQSDREGDLGIWWQRADGNGAAERLTKPEKGAAHIPDSWSPDGQYFSFSEENNGDSAVWTYSLRDKKATVFAEKPGAMLQRSAFSPDGKWIAYQATSQPNSRIYVRPFPRNDTLFAAPEDNDSHHPVWSPDGSGLFYIPGADRLASVRFKAKPGVAFGSPVQLPRAGLTTAVPTSVRTYDMMPDGQHFLGVVPAGQDQASAAGPPKLQVVLNWFEEVKQRAPAK